MVHLHGITKYAAIDDNHRIYLVHRTVVPRVARNDLDLIRGLSALSLNLSVIAPNSCESSCTELPAER